MIWVVVFVLTVSVALNVLLTVLVFTSSQRGAILLDRSHARTVEYTEDLLNRLMVRDWTQYVDMNAVVPQLEEEEATVIQWEPTLGPDRGGFGSRYGLAAYAAQDEEIDPEKEMQ